MPQRPDATADRPACERGTGNRFGPFPSGKSSAEIPARWSRRFGSRPGGAARLGHLPSALFSFTFSLVSPWFHRRVSRRFSIAFRLSVSRCFSIAFRRWIFRCFSIAFRLSIFRQVFSFGVWCSRLAVSAFRGLFPAAVPFFPPGQSFFARKARFSFDLWCLV